MIAAQRRQVLEIVVDQGPDRVRTIAYIGAPDTDAVVALARDAESVGAAALVAVPPDYRHTADAIVGHVEALVGAVSIPVYA